MKIVHINNTDLTGRRFNGHDIQIAFNRRGISCKQFVIEKRGTDPNTISIVKEFEEPFLRNSCRLFENNLSVQSMIYPYGWRIFRHPEFTSADIAHYHLLHNYFFSYAMLPELVVAKPSVMTIHDPWIFTGHCIYPIDCKKWETEECTRCPHLDRHFSIKKDNANYMWKIKKEIFSDLNVDLVVASKWMLDMVKRSPVTAHIQNVHLIPFGIDAKVFHAKRNKILIRKQLGIPLENIVLFFRADPSLYKGLSYIQKMLERLRTSKPITLLTVGSMGLVYAKNHQLIEKDWINDENSIAELYAVADIFLMPSIAEAFGMMAIEAMMSGLPVIVFDGTALPDITFAPDCGIVIKNRDIELFTKTIERLIENPEECIQRGEMGHRLASKYYDIEDHFRIILELYEDILARKKIFRQKQGG
jgi:glycosyltransferase involved in cell wall biosynthesis